MKNNSFLILALSTFVLASSNLSVQAQSYDEIRGELNRQISLYNQYCRPPANPNIASKCEQALNNIRKLQSILCEEFGECGNDRY